VTVRAVDGDGLTVEALEAVDGTPVVDLKPVLGPVAERWSRLRGVRCRGAELHADQGQQRGMRLPVRRSDQPADTGVHRLSLDAGHHGAGGLAQRDTAAEVLAVLAPAVVT
jgi:hypothetical protein